MSHIWRQVTGAPLIAAARRVWRGEIDQTGVSLPEDMIAFDDFEAEVAELLPDIPAHGRLLEQRFGFLA